MQETYNVFDSVTIIFIIIMLTIHVNFCTNYDAIHYDTIR